MELTFITPDHALYASELELRFRVLREPLGHTRADVPFPFERESLHLVAHEANEVRGCVLFHPESSERGRLFQMAVQGQRAGLGTRLVHALEAELRARGFTQVHLHAREDAVGFYQKLGYAAYGEPYLEVGVVHRNMQRTL